MKTILRTVTTTTFKKKPIQSSELPEDLKAKVEANQEFELASFTIERDHLRCTFATPFKDSVQWYVFSKHVEIRNDSQLSFPAVLPTSVKLDIPYKSQRDNVLNPDGSCNVTSIAMCLRFLGAQRKSTVGQFEDELYDYAERNRLSRHSPYDLARIVEAYGYRDDFRPDATIEQVKAWLASGKPAVIHGYFTDFGHIVVLAGYDEYGFIAHDPYGEWYSWGYDSNDAWEFDTKGKFVHYSYDLIKRLCIPDGNFWVHFISKP
ncbi:C39 family peptidase [Alkalinema sp. FACHB-956]|uniref:C39 family peptidase n=1 Tax=Alkalinema sp. FACHB-956 TaxID=2692768 RepID=UPI001687540F|nr:C39 family peptidase [Alkalinema sp. FACHB-956]MBD2327082.1 C39 family peptidase [Alkalinema sp. FACHB-956]